MSSSSNQANAKEEATATAFPTGQTVPFPYETPYPQQLDLMEAILESLQARRILRKGQQHEQNRGASLYMLESPTGTGKSLSLAAATLAWLKYQEDQDLQPLMTKSSHDANHDDDNDNDSSNSTPWWEAWESPLVRDARERENRVRDKATTTRRTLAVALQDLRRRQRQRIVLEGGDGGLAERKYVLQQALREIRGDSKRQRAFKKHKRAGTAHDNATNTTKDDFVLSEYLSEDESDNRKNRIVLTYEDEEDGDSSDENVDYSKRRRSRQSTTTAISDNPLASLQGSWLDGSAAAAALTAIHQTWTAVGGVTPGSGVRKIVYAARTHSQLSQFVREVRRIPGLGATLRLVALGGRQALCGNSELRRKYKGREREWNDACLDLQKGSAGNKKRKDQTANSASSGCPLLASREAVSTLALHLLTEPTDIEQAATLGGETAVCSYYASRQSLAAAQVVVLPYNMLLSAKTRSAVGLSLQGALVIVDEAHNLPEALRAIHSTRLSLPVVQAALGQMGRYVEKYRDRLAGRNLVYLGQLRKTLLSFQKNLQKPPSKTGEKLLSVEDFLTKLRLQNTNFFKLLRYLELSRLSQKLLGFMNQQQGGEQDEEEEKTNSEKLSKHVSAMSLVETFLQKLTSTEDQGKIVIEDDSRKAAPAFRFVLLDPAAFLDPIIKEAHAVALVGGTLRPFGHVASELLVDKEIQQSALSADRAIAQTPVEQGSYKQIADRFTAFSCGHVVSPDRVFLRCFSHGPNGHKFDFRHVNRGTNATMDELGCALTKVMKSVPSGGIVVFIGSYSYEAKLVARWKQQGVWNEMRKIASVFREPTNSRDVDRTLKDYSRCATSTGALLLSVIGGKMSEGINFADDMARCVVIVGLPYPDITDPELQEKMSALDRSPDTGITGKSYYQNLCMRAVNQSAGRAIRHANDYAAIVLLDERYTTDLRVWQALPTWLTGEGRAIQKRSTFPDGERDLQAFFEKFTG